jgi:hypothetical protein
MQCKDRFSLFVTAGRLESAMLLGLFSSGGTTDPMQLRRIQVGSSLLRRRDAGGNGFEKMYVWKI